MSLRRGHWTLLLLNIFTREIDITHWTLLTAERIWFKCDLYLRFIPPINLWKVCIDLRPFSKYFNEPFSRTLRSPRSNNLEIQNDENSKWKLVKTRWNPKFGLSDLKNDHLTSKTLCQILQKNKFHLFFRTEQSRIRKWPVGTATIQWRLLNLHSFVV